jgi:hypothetical protein
MSKKKIMPNAWQNLRLIYQAANEIPLDEDDPSKGFLQICVLA